MIKVLGIDHVVLRVRDLDAMLHFYRDALGCGQEIMRDDIGLYQLRAGRSLIDIVPIDGKLGQMDGGAAPDPKARNMHHFCLRIEGFDEAKIRAHLSRFGIEAGPVEERNGAEGIGPSLYMEDPEGNVVELKGPPLPPSR